MRLGTTEIILIVVLALVLFGGSKLAGVGKALGWKHGRWVDIVWMRKALNGGDANAPEATGMILGGA